MELNITAGDRAGGPLQQGCPKATLPVRCALSGAPYGEQTQPHATAAELLPGHSSGEQNLAMSFGGRSQKGSFSMGLGAFTASRATKVPLQPLHRAEAVLSKPAESFRAAKVAFPNELGSSPSLWRSSALPAPYSCPSRSSDQDGPAPRGAESRAGAAAALPPPGSPGAGPGD